MLVPLFIIHFHGIFPSKPSSYRGTPIHGNPISGGWSRFIIQITQICGPQIIKIQISCSKHFETSGFEDPFHSNIHFSALFTLEISKAEEIRPGLRSQSHCLCREGVGLDQGGQWENPPIKSYKNPLMSDILIPKSYLEMVQLMEVIYKILSFASEHHRYFFSQRMFAWLALVLLTTLAIWKVMSTNNWIDWGAQLVTGGHQTL